MELLKRMRILGSGLVIAAYFITLHLDVVTGVIVHLAAISISMPYFVKSKAWDVVIMFSFIMTIGIGRLFASGVAWLYTKLKNTGIIGRSWRVALSVLYNLLACGLLQVVLVNCLILSPLRRCSDLKCCWILRSLKLKKVRIVINALPNQKNFLAAFLSWDMSLLMPLNCIAYHC